MHDPMDDDHQLELYLKRFRPLPPEPLLLPLPLPQREGPWSVFALRAGAVAWAVATTVLVLLLIPQFRHVPATPVGAEPITAGKANAMLVHAASWKEMIDDAGFAFRPPVKRMEPGRQSALEFLSQEELSK